MLVTREKKAVIDITSDTAEPVLTIRPVGGFQDSIVN